MTIARRKRGRPMATDVLTHAGPIVPDNKLQLLRDTYARGSSQQEFELFVAVANRLRLDPFARQIYAVRRYDPGLKREVLQAQVSIDGMRLTAERTGQYAGQGAPQWCGFDGQWVDVWLDEDPPAAARVAVFRRDFAQPILGIALFREYAQYKQSGELTRFWAVMPANQLAKCAEAAALRKAFPNELSGVYTAEEMAQGDAEPVSQPHPQKAPPPPRDDRPRFHRAWANPTWAGLPLADASVPVLDEYLEALDRALADNRRKKLHPELRQARDAALAVHESKVLAAMDSADPIADGLQAEAERLADAKLAVENDNNADWGLDNA